MIKIGMLFIKVNLKEIKELDSAQLFKMIKVYIMVNLVMIFLMVMEYIIFLMEVDLKVILLMGKKMIKVI